MGRTMGADSMQVNLKRTASIKDSLDLLYRHRSIKNFGTTGEAIMAIFRQVQELESLIGTSSDAWLSE